jgi:hypothetical protein
MTTNLPGASPWEQRLYDNVTRHVRDESEILDAYERLVDETDSPAFAYLAQLILDDERRHHRMLADLAETIRISVEMSGEPTPIPELALFKADRDRILAETKRFLAVERQDNRELKALTEDLRDVRKHTLWQLVLRLIQHDNNKHREILQFVHDRAAEER